MIAKISPLFRLSDLQLSEAIMSNLEAHFVNELIKMEEADTLGQIAGLDALARYTLANEVRVLYLRNKAKLRQDQSLEHLLDPKLDATQIYLASSSLSPRVRNLLLRAGYVTAADLTSYTYNWLMYRTPNLGPKGMEQIVEWLRGLGLALKEG